ncbi:PREDICTED: uncharacterized protein LOC108555687 [Eufriesea mexicana]|uniref:uncharacterized protein LOC108555687 n=1 Tax=Eufriesea mexicana TaxID=516756 RepID=UPI00083C7CE8|nr:PREDICTED: uncharacterized protein LOC108555687 [Eufriesea mexicana]
MPTANPYTTLKTKLIARLGVTNEVRMRRLLESEGMMGKKPSQFLRRLHWYGGIIQEDELRTLWYSRLPANIRVILACHKDMDLNKVAEIADDMIDALGPCIQVAEAANTRRTEAAVPHTWMTEAAPAPVRQGQSARDTHDTQSKIISQLSQLSLGQESRRKDIVVIRERIIPSDQG